MANRSQIAGATLCPVCNSTHTEPVLETVQVPVHCNVLCPSAQAAETVGKGDIRLVFCGDCDHLFNDLFDPALMDYSQDYENSLHYSSRFQSYAEALARQLVDRHGLYGKDILEIGCGSGDFLKLLCYLGGNRGLGFDPGYRNGESGMPQDSDIRIIRDAYTEKYANHRADFFCCRQVLEHMASPGEFVGGLRRMLHTRQQQVVFFEVPDAMFTIKDMSIWDIIYEHVSYFSALSLERLFALSGFRVDRTYSSFEGQYLCIEARPADRKSESGKDRSHDRRRISRYVASFAGAYREKVDFWTAELEKLEQNGKRAVIWGGGSKGVTFLNIFKARPIGCVVDINPHKHGKFIPGTGHEIIAPDALPGYAPDVVIVMNGIYLNEIQETIDRMGLSASLIPV